MGEVLPRRCGAIGLTGKFDNRPGHFDHDHACDLGISHNGFHICFKCREPFGSRCDSGGNGNGRKPRLLDLFCGAGGAAMGYHRAGFDVVGVDIVDQPNYPFEFHRLDAMAMKQDRVQGCWHEGAGSALPGMSMACLGHFDAIHASPPCQAYCAPRFINRSRTSTPREHPKLIEPVRSLLRATGLPYVIENVPQAPLIEPVTLCGSMFGLRVRRHRRFESNVLLMRRSCEHGRQGKNFVGVYGDHPEARTLGEDDRYVRAFRAASIDEAREAMGMPWADWKGCKEAIPPAYTEFIGTQLVQALVQAEAAS